MKPKKRKAEYDGVWEERGRSLPVPSVLRGNEKTLNRSHLTGLLPTDNRMEKKRSSEDVPNLSSTLKLCTNYGRGPHVITYPPRVRVDGELHTCAVTALVPLKAY